MSRVGIVMASGALAFAVGCGTTSGHGQDAGTPSDAGSGCSRATDCSSCNDMFRCGWCASTNTCIRGDLGGPDGGTCSDWHYGNCPCSMFSGGCSDCLASTWSHGCGWCASTSTCMAASPDASAGPAIGSCTDWSSNRTMCADYCTSTPDCSAAATCAACTAVPTCGWCSETNACMKGSVTGPASACDSGMCTWAFLGTECPGAGDAGM